MEAWHNENVSNTQTVSCAVREMLRSNGAMRGEPGSLIYWGERVTYDISQGDIYDTSTARCYLPQDDLLFDTINLQIINFTQYVP